MKEEFEKLAAAGKIEGRHVEPLTLLAESGCCMHRSWGFGRIKTVDTVFARFTIDFAGKPGHTMDLGFAVESLKPIPKDHILARKANDLESVRQMAAHHLELIKLVLNSYGGRATADQIQQALVPDVIRDDWKKWWETARREMKKDGHFIVPLKKTEPVVFQAQETSLQTRLMVNFRAAKGLKARVAIVSEISKSAPDLTDKQAAAAEIITALNADIMSYQRTQPGVALEAIFARDELREIAGLPPVPDDHLESRRAPAGNPGHRRAEERQDPGSHRTVARAFPLPAGDGLQRGHLPGGLSGATGALLSPLGPGASASRAASGVAA